MEPDDYAESSLDPEDHHLPPAPEVSFSEAPLTAPFAFLPAATQPDKATHHRRGSQDKATATTNYHPDFPQDAACKCNLGYR